MTALTIEPGTALLATDASGREFATRALSGVEAGHKFPIVWIECINRNGVPDRVPWPVESLRRVQ